GDAEERAERMGREVDEHDFDAEGSEGQPSVEVESVESNFDRQTYEEAVERVQERIREGETFQANISQRLGFDTDAEPVEVYSALRRTNPAPYMGLFELDSGSVVSTSPELLLRKTGDELRTRPIAGTRPRGDDESEDEELRDDLKASEKERAEHSILVDLERNDLGKVSEYGTVTVERFMETVRYPEVQHLESVVTGNARDGTGAFDALAAMFPGGTVTGAPKPRTLSIIEEVEPTERGPYTGSLGHVSLTGDATFNILIRTVVTDGSRSYLQVGGGVVHDSDPSEEYAETLDKAKGVLNALESRDEDQEVGIGTW
ncbi:MAG: anthranilate synthase component I family protein, partial [Halobacteria archaeon]|nr:anthranilate synthase component I family protein [Halobacteria archaeon]